MTHSDIAKLIEKPYYTAAGHRRPPTPDMLRRQRKPALLTSFATSYKMQNMDKSLGYPNTSHNEPFTVEETLQVLFSLKQEVFSFLLERRTEWDKSLPTRLQFHVLNAVNNRERTSISDVASLLNVSGPTASQLVQMLVKREWLTREAESRDRRRQTLHLSPVGHNLLKTHHQQQHQYASRILAELSSGERRSLLNLATRLSAIWKSVSTSDETNERSPKDGAYE